MADAGTDIRTERKPKLSERVVAALRSQVLSGEISPGQKMPTENQLTETFGVSRTVIREAIATLAADGLVEPRQGAGVFVRDHPMLAFGSISLDIGNVVDDVNRAGNQAQQDKAENGLAQGPLEKRARHK